MLIRTRRAIRVGASRIRVGAMWPSVGATGARGAAGCAFRTDCTSRTLRTGCLPRSLAERAVVLRDHLFELVGHFVGACEHDGLIARFDLATETELETLQPFGREGLEALQFF